MVWWEPISCFVDCCDVTVSSLGRRAEGAPQGHFYKGTNPIHEGSTLLTLSNSNYLSKAPTSTFLLAQWLRIHLPKQGTWIRPLAWGIWAPVPQLLGPLTQAPMLCNKRSCHSEKPEHHNSKAVPCPLAATRESLCTATKTQCSQKQDKYIF